MLKKAAWGFLIFLLLILLFIVSAVAPIDYSPMESFEEVRMTREILDTIDLKDHHEPGQLLAGWSSVNITPRIPINMAGYGPRGPYTNVADSLYARIAALDNGHCEAFIISLDLLMFPRTIRKMLEDRLAQQGIHTNQLYLTATHTHNGFGNWDDSLVGEFIFGDFDTGNTDFLIDQIVAGIASARKAKAPAKIGFEKIDAGEWVVNRLAPKHGTKDPFLRVIHLIRNDEKKALLVSFSAHAVNLHADIWELSRDYPGVLIDQLEHDPSVDLAMFCAGMVGSHNLNSKLSKGHERIQQAGRQLAEKILTDTTTIKLDSVPSLLGADLPIKLPPSQLRLTKHLRLRDWVFRSLFGPLEANIKVLNIGDILLIGMPCDYSGELSINNNLDQLASRHGHDVFITSFNGNYVGYITEDSHYTTCNHDEVRTLNWVGPHKGNFFTDVLKQLIQKAS